MAKKFNPSSATDRFAKLGNEVKKAQKRTDRTEMIPVSSIIMNDDNVFSINDTEEEIKSLAENIKENGLIHNITVAEVAPDQYLLISGERRTRAVKSLGRETIKANIKSGLSEFEIMKLLFFANSETREYTTEEKINIIDNFKEKLKKIDIDDRAALSAFNSYVSEAFNINQRQASKLVSISSELSGPLKELLFSNTIDINTAAAFAQLPESYQAQAADIIINKKSCDIKEAVSHAIDFTRLAKKIISRSNNSISKNRTSQTYYNKRVNCAKDEIAHLTQILTENNVTEEEKADIEKQTTALNTAINKYKNIIKELEDKEKTALAAQDQEVEKLFTEIAENKSACSKIQLSDDETIYKEAKKIDSSIKKLLKLDDSEELEQINAFIEKFLSSHKKY